MITIENDYMEGKYNKDSNIIKNTKLMTSE